VSSQAVEPAIAPTVPIVPGPDPTSVEITVPPVIVPAITVPAITLPVVTVPPVVVPDLQLPAISDLPKLP